MTKKKLLIINKAQFGYHTDSYKYCEYLKNKFDLTYICFDTNKKKYTIDGVNIIYVSYSGSFFQRGYSYIKFCRKHIKKNNFDLVLAVYFPMVSFITLFNYKINFLLDIRTGAVNKSKIRRRINDYIMIKECSYFKNISVISKSLMDKLNLNINKCDILPLGSDIMVSNIKEYINIKLLYVGTLSSRDIHKTVEGLSIFYEKHKNDNIIISYDIFGDGNVNDTELLKKSITKYNATSYVKYHGRKNHKELKLYFDKCNVGVSFIPITEYFDCQPPTKTYEYINSGMICLATNTKENRKLITNKNGILHYDTVESFSEALDILYIKKSIFSTINIINSLKMYNWKNIINNNLIPIINRISD